ncbi:MAG: sulfurtransferase [Pseudomonadales bacterium]|jgi:thiosulfate/3-mercaptopyruvate sulfurtransferase|nr:sulfurtransferase [Pseudomonadales bacterium]
MNTLISPLQLASLLEHDAVTVFDCRFSLADVTAGARAYAQGHIPRAFYAHLNDDLSLPHTPGKTGRHPLPPRGQWLAHVLRWGLTPERQVVVYDDAGGAIAARLWWMLQWIGHDKVAVLDGGIAAWQRAGQPLSQVAPALPHAAPNHYATLPPLVTQVLVDGIGGGRQVLLDARDPARYRGEMEPIDPVAGHIPGARNLPFNQNLNADGTFRSKAELERQFASVASCVLPVVCYCGSGVTACHNVLAMKLAGLTVPALYAGSWSEWVADPARPVAQGEQP